jgi:cytochrome c oxidase assembly factor 2
MPPHLHPRSSATSTLFASTLAASFVIVGIPHIFPCPAPRQGYFEEGDKVLRRRQRRRRSKGESDGVDRLGKADEGQRMHTGTANVQEDGHGQLRLDGESKLLPGSAKAVSDPRAWSSARVRTEGVGRGGDGTKEGEDEDEDEEEAVRALFRDMKEEASVLEKERRECPIPKPRGKIGALLGFRGDGRRPRSEDES